MNLKRKNYSNKQVMSVSGHKSKSSIKIYHQINDSEKLSMGNDLAKTLILKTELTSYPWNNMSYSMGWR